MLEPEIDRIIDDETVRIGLEAVLPDHVSDVWRLLGTGVSAVVVGVHARLAGSNSGQTRLVALRYDASTTEQAAQRDGRLLNHLYAHGLPVPACHGVAKVKVAKVEVAKVKVAGLDDIVVTAMDWLPGRSGEQVGDPITAAHDVAGVLHKVHQVPWQGLELPDFELCFDPVPDDVLKESPEFLQCAIRHRPGPRERVLLHGDFWPGNLMFAGHEFCGLIDWSDACIGDPLVDVANARYEILWLWGEAAMAVFTNRYFELSARTARELPSWDLHAVLKPLRGMGRWGLSGQQQTSLAAAIALLAENATAALGDA